MAVQYLKQGDTRFEGSMLLDAIAAANVPSPAVGEIALFNNVSNSNKLSAKINVGGTVSVVEVIGGTVPGWSTGHVAAPVAETNYDTLAVNDFYVTTTGNIFRKTVNNVAGDTFVQVYAIPTIPAAQVRSNWNATEGIAVIDNKPTIPAAQVRSNWNATEGIAVIDNKPTIPATPGGVGLGNVTNIKNKLDATVAPAVGNNGTEGYSVGSHWFDITHTKVYVCLSSATGAAVWSELTNSSAGALLKLDGTVAPAVTDDNTAGYSVSSIWYDTTHTKAYACFSVATRAAVWAELTGTSGGSGGGSSTPDPYFAALFL